MARLGLGLNRGGEMREEIFPLPPSLSRSLSHSFLFRPGTLLATLSQWKISVALGLVMVAVSSRLSVVMRVVMEQPAVCACL